MKKIILLVMLMLGSGKLLAESVIISMDIPDLKVDPYHRPYVAVWLETPDRKGLHTIALWHDKNDWLKDLRQWWRKLGRNDALAYQGVSGATRKPGVYSFSWDGKNTQGEAFPAGEYLLCLEAAREAGGRDFFKTTIQLGQNQTQHYQLQGDTELSSINLTIEP